MNILSTFSRVISKSYLRKNLFNLFRFDNRMDQIINEINKNHVSLIGKLDEIENKLKTIEKESEITKQVKTQELDIEKEKLRIKEENLQLKEQISNLINKLNQLENVRQQFTGQTNIKPIQHTQQVNQEEIKPYVKQEKKEKQVTKESGKSAKKEDKKNQAEKKNNEDNKPIDASRLDLRVGRIINAKKHPDADSLYVEEIDCGEEKPRTVVSGLVKYVPLEEMENRMVIVLCNLKPVKMRGITSEAMVMCASTTDKVEILSPPDGALPGDRVVFDEFPGQPDIQLNPKKKIWEQIAPDLKTNHDRVATYKGCAFKIPDKGLIMAPSLTNVQVK